MALNIVFAGTPEFAAEHLRKADPSTDVLLIGNEPEPPYSRMAIPYYLTGKIDEAGTYLRKTGGHYENLGIQYREGMVESVDPGNGKLTLAGGDTVLFNQMLVTTGASPIKPPIDGLDLAGVHHLTKTDATEPKLAVHRARSAAAAASIPRRAMRSTAGRTLSTCSCSIVMATASTGGMPRTSSSRSTTTRFRQVRAKPCTTNCVCHPS